MTEFEEVDAVVRRIKEVGVTNVTPYTSDHIGFTVKTLPMTLSRTLDRGFFGGITWGYELKAFTDPITTISSKGEESPLHTLWLYLTNMLGAAPKGATKIMEALSD